MDQLPRAKHTLIFSSGKLERNFYRIMIDVVVAIAIFFFWAYPVAKIALLILVIHLLSLMVASQWIIEVDRSTRRMILFRRFLLRWKLIPLRTTIFENCSFDECSEVGTRRVLPGDEGRPPFYQVYVDFKRGGRHVIPVQGATPSSAVELASELSALTGIPMCNAPENY